MTRRSDPPKESRLADRRPQASRIRSSFELLAKRNARAFRPIGEGIAGSAKGEKLFKNGERANMYRPYQRSCARAGG
jgi:hypothetical protein